MIRYLLFVFLLWSSLTTVDSLRGLDVNDTVINSWKQELPKQSPLATVLVGDCKIHFNAVKELSDGMAMRIVKGGEGVFERVVNELRAACNDVGCPSQLIFIFNAESTPEREFKDLSYALFFNGRNCQTPEFGGFNRDCSRVWFVISTCFASQLLDYSMNELEQQIPTVNEVETEGRYELRSKWPFTGISNWIVRAVVDDQVSAQNVGQLARQFIIRRRKEQDDENQRKVEEATGTKPRNVNTKASLIDLSVLAAESSGYSGQEWARTAVERALTAVQKNQKLNKGPLVFFFLGPAGTGKTMLAKLVARAYHGGELVSVLESRGNFRIFSMASYKSEEDVDAFVSPRAGLVGEGSMVDVFRQSKRPVIVLDEIEKAHPKLISEMLLSWIDDNDGFVQDKKDSAKRYSTENAIFILTSNCFAAQISKASIETGGNAEEISNRVLHLLRSEDASPSKHVGANSNCNAFKREEVMRRMAAGHALAELRRYGFVVFLPPTLRQVDDAVLAFLKDYQKKHLERNGGGFFWTDRALAMLTKEARRDVTSSRGMGGLSAVSSGLYETIGRAIRIALNDAENELGHGNDILLYVHNQELVARLVSVTASSGEIPSSSRASERGIQQGTGIVPPFEIDSVPTSGEASSSGRACSKSDLALEVEEEEQLLEAKETNYLEWLQIAVWIAIYLALGYFFWVVFGLSIAKAVLLSTVLSVAPLLVVVGGYVCYSSPELCGAIGKFIRYVVLPLITFIYQFFGPRGLLVLFVIVFVLPYSWLKSLFKVPLSATSAAIKTTRGKVTESVAGTTPSKTVAEPRISPSLNKARPRTLISTPYGIGILREVRETDNVYIVDFGTFDAVDMRMFKGVDFRKTFKGVGYLQPDVIKVIPPQMAN